MKFAFLIITSCFLSLFTHAQWTTSGTYTYLTTTTNTVGIGTTTPSRKLHVYGTTNTNDVIFQNTSSTGQAAVEFIPSGTNYILGATGSANSVFPNAFYICNHTNLTYPFVLTGNSIGINTIPMSTFHIKSTSGNLDLVLETASGNAKWDLAVDQTNMTAGFYDVLSNTSPFIVSKGAPNNSIFVSAGGNVLMGKNTQNNTAYKLDINGSARANKVVVNTTGADFVFDSSYDLKSLDSVSSYIAQNKHLPGIAPAADMQKDGVDLGDAQTKLLQKIEELTLYLIDQNKQLKNQEKVIQQILSEQESLRQQNTVLQNKLQKAKE